jgi:hypothetical protein
MPLPDIPEFMAWLLPKPMYLKFSFQNRKRPELSERSDFGFQ